MISINRLPQDPHSTPGKLSVDGVYFCRTLELPVVDGRPGSAIPAGRYIIEFAPSPKFMSNPDPWVQRYASRMPHIVDIPGRSLIMLHWGNDEQDTEGCVITGITAATDWVGGSRSAFENLYPQLHDGDVIEVVDAPNNAEDVEDAAQNER